jgi:uncharacterized protein (TIGR02217 family)
MSDFHEILFPVDISFGSHGGPKWKTSVFMADSGFEARVSDWTSTRAEYDVSQGIKTQVQMDALTAFFYARRGRAYGFRFKDWNDFTADNLTIGHGDYANVSFQIIKTYESAGPDGVVHTFSRPLKKIVWASEVNVKIGGSQVFLVPEPQFYAIDNDTGVLTFGIPPIGATYSGSVATSTIDYVTTAEGGHANGYFGRSVTGGAVAYDYERGLAYPLATFNLGGFGGANGLRVIDMTTNAEIAQKTSNQLGTLLSPTQPFGDTSAIQGLIGVNQVDGAIFVTVGNGFEFNSVAKIDPTSLTIVATYGHAGNIVQDPSVPPLNAPGCCSRDGAFFVILPFIQGFPNGENVYYHSTVDCARLGMIHAGSAIACSPFRESGFAVLNHHGPTATPLKLVLMSGAGLVRDAITFGNPAAVGRWVLYDQKTRGMLVCWQEAAVDQFWCGLFDPDKGDWAWTRPMPRMIGYGGTAPEPQTPIDGTFCWVLTDPQFGTNLWFLDTTTGALTTRVAPTGYGIGETFDPNLNKLLTIDASHTLIYSTGVTGATFQPAPAVTIDHVEFHVPVRFDTDHLNPKHEFWLTQSWDQIPLVEVRDWNDVDVD